MMCLLCIRCYFGLFLSMQFLGDSRKQYLKFQTKNKNLSEFGTKTGFSKFKIYKFDDLFSIIIK